MDWAVPVAGLIRLLDRRAVLARDRNRPASGTGGPGSFRKAGFTAVIGNAELCRRLALAKSRERSTKITLNFRVVDHPSTIPQPASNETVIGKSCGYRLSAHCDDCDGPRILTRKAGDRLSSPESSNPRGRIRPTF